MTTYALRQLSLVASRRGHRWSNRLLDVLLSDQTGHVIDIVEMKVRPHLTTASGAVLLHRRLHC